MANLSPGLEEAYQAVAQEIETQTVILGISLNDALGECESGDSENALRLVRLAIGQWDRLAENVVMMLKIIADRVPYARSGLAVHRLNTSRFRSRAMLDFVSMRDALDQVIVRSKQRCQFHVGVLRRAVEALSGDFRRTYRDAERVPECRFEMWHNVDPAFQDFDLIIKESLLTLRGLLAALPESAVRDFVSDLNKMVARGVRTKAAASGSPEP